MARQTSATDSADELGTVTRGNISTPEMGRPSASEMVNGTLAVRSCGVGRPERRATPRMPYDGLVGFCVIGPSRQHRIPTVFRAVDISFSGISIIGRQFLCPGTTGVMQIVRPDGTAALVCVYIATCQSMDNLDYLIGMEFGPLPAEIRIDDLLDAQGRMLLMDPLLLESIDRG
jgi:hypothetical protein